MNIVRPYNRHPTLRPGLRVNRITVGNYDPDINKWRCQCDCGTALAYSAAYLSSNRPPESCGCSRKGYSRPRLSRTERGLDKEHKAIYAQWQRMMSLCYSPTNNHYKYYGGRGIRVAQEWHDFNKFVEDMDPRESPRHVICRVDNDHPYSPANCYWGTPTKRQPMPSTYKKNKPAPHRLASIANLAKQAGLSAETVYRRVSEGWPLARALSEPRQTNVVGRVLYEGQSFTVPELAKKLGLHYVTIYEWVHKGKIERAP